MFGSAVDRSSEDGPTTSANLLHQFTSSLGDNNNANEICGHTADLYRQRISRLIPFSSEEERHIFKVQILKLLIRNF